MFPMPSKDIFQIAYHNYGGSLRILAKCPHGLAKIPPDW